ncbi:MAG TPA: transglycosylase domain-containing protein [Pseudonocardia sp.]|nr:transglycosylase domain-containing protein [Pseudonocardia sp.]
MVRLALQAAGAGVLAGVLVAAMLVVPVAGLARVATAPLPAVTAAPAALPDPDATPLASVITDAGGTPIARVYEQYRIPTPPEEIPEVMREAVIAIEDRRFPVHNGVDWRGIARALLTNLQTSGNPFDGQGGSTITMQYAKIQRLYVQARTPEERASAVADTLSRKLDDVRVALELERQLSKREILTRYLDTVYFGNGAYGIGAAARTYFGTTPGELTLPQAALLAGVIRAPALYDPVASPAAAQSRRDLVLDAMAETGAVSAGEAAAARATDLGVVEPLRPPPDGCIGARPGTGFFCRYLLDHLEDLGLDRAAIGSGGYTIRSTLDLRVTEAARRAAVAQVPVDRTRGIANAVAVVQPGRDGHRVLALAANRDLGVDADAGQTAYALPSEPVPYGAGSTFKIFTAVAAMERGIGLDTELPAPEEYVSEVFRDDGEPYSVTGDGGVEDGLTTLREALALSPNTTFLALLDEIGSVDPVVDAAQRLGLRESLDRRDAQGRTVAEAVRADQRASFTLGPVPTSPLELANVAATLVSGGVWCPPSPVDAVVDSAGREVALPEPECERAVPEDLADTLVAGLSEDHTIGTAAAAADAAGWDRPMIGKTGTTQQNLSAAFVGATPQLAGAVMTWADGSPPSPVCDGDPPRLCDAGTLFGGTVPARTWFATMTPLHADLRVAALPDPVPRYVAARVDEVGG